MALSSTGDIAQGHPQRLLRALRRVPEVDCSARTAPLSRGYGTVRISKTRLTLLPVAGLSVGVLEEIEEKTDAQRQMP
ncbi:MAG: hypothetical protein ACTHJZ_00575, partial [Trinickia sp.]|uniref:hypothetical protein n=1 Tax=Trinickia sp. TaxID=2571163 RepID=UPI003F7D7F13